MRSVSPNLFCMKSFSGQQYKKMVNIGQLIKEELEKQGRSAGWLAKELHCNRSTVYRALGRNSIDTAMLADISKALHKDFFKILSDSL